MKQTVNSAVHSLRTIISATAATAAITAAKKAAAAATRSIIALSATKPMKMIPAATAIRVPIVQSYAPDAETPAVTVLIYVRTVTSALIV